MQSNSNVLGYALAVIVGAIIGFYVGRDVERRDDRRPPVVNPANPSAEDDRPAPRPRVPFRVGERCVIVRSAGSVGTLEVNQEFGPCRIQEVAEDFVRVRDSRGKDYWISRLLIRRLPEQTGTAPIGQPGAMQ